LQIKNIASSGLKAHLDRNFTEAMHCKDRTCGVQYVPSAMPSTSNARVDADIKVVVMDYGSGPHK